MPQTEKFRSQLQDDDSILKVDGVNSAVQKAFAILEFVARASGPVTLSELEFHLQASKTSIHRVVQQLEASGLLLRDVSGRRYRLGVRLAHFAFEALSSVARVSPAHNILKRLVDDIGESCNFGVLSDKTVIYIDRVESKWPLRTHVLPGSRAPIHCTGIGKLLLAFMPERDRRELAVSLELQSYTPNTITDLITLNMNLERIRADGFAINDQEYMHGMISVAVPVLSASGRVVAGVAFETPVIRMTVEDAKLMIPRLIQAATELSEAVIGRDHD